MPGAALLLSYCGAVTFYVPARSPLLRTASSATRTATLVAREARETEETSKLDAILQRGLPKDQQPVREVQNLRAGFAYDWATDEGYGKKLLQAYAALMFVVSLPVAYDTYTLLPDQLPELLAAAHTGTAAFLLVFVLRLRNGWGFVERRLKERVTYYETEKKGGFLARKDNEEGALPALTPSLGPLDVGIPRQCRPQHPPSTPWMGDLRQKGQLGAPPPRAQSHPHPRDSAAHTHTHRARARLCRTPVLGEREGEIGTTTFAGSAHAPPQRHGRLPFATRLPLQ